MNLSPLETYEANLALLRKSPGTDPALAAMAVGHCAASLPLGYSTICASAGWSVVDHVAAKASEFISKIKTARAESIAASLRIKAGYGR